MAAFDDEILLLRPVEGGVDTAAIEAYLAATPGAFRDPVERATWILAGHPQSVDALQRARLEQPGRYPLDPRIAVSPEDVMVVPGTEARERAFVAWLLSQAPWELSATPGSKDFEERPVLGLAGSLSSSSSRYKP